MYVNQKELAKIVLQAALFNSLCDFMEIPAEKRLTFDIDIRMIEDMKNWRTGYLLRKEFMDKRLATSPSSDEKAV